MSSDCKIDRIGGKRIKPGESHEQITTFCGTYRNLIVDCFKNKCMEFYTKQLDDKSVRAYKTFKSTG